MDPQFQQWQQSFQQSTPKVNVQQLIVQVSKMYQREKLKAWIDLIVGFAVSTFCVYFWVVHADTRFSQIVVALLTPIPIAFSIWAYRLRQKQPLEHSLDISQLLQCKRQKLVNQVHYWKVSALIFSGLWLGLALIAGFNYFTAVNGNLWLSHVVVQAGILILTWIRFGYLQKHLAPRLAQIDSLN